MEKFLLKSKTDLEKLKEHFKDQDCNELIDEVVKKLPCVLIASFSNDVDFGDFYQFDIVTVDDFDFMQIPFLSFGLN